MKNMMKMRKCRQIYKKTEYITLENNIDKNKI